MPEEYPCPACGFLTNDEPPGSFNICRICGWEDDHVQLAHPRMRGGANGESLCEAQAEALKDYPLAIQEAEGIKRDPQWRPLAEEGAAICVDAPKTGYGYFEAATAEEPGYYWRKPGDGAEPDAP